MHDRLRTSAREKMTAVSARLPEISIIIPTTGWNGTFKPCARRALELIERSCCDAELVVVLDGTASAPPRWLVRPDVQVLSTGSPSGPAVARNRAAAAARAGILFFVDADVELADGSIDLVHARFRDDPELHAVFGTYDDEPVAAGTASQFRNLLHHHTHVVHPGRANTFWSGCGAMRSGRFLAAGGFDGRYRYPSVEDIELGTRVTAAGGRIELDPDLRCKHHKDWTVRSMVYTDIACRAVPWTRMMLKTRRSPACLAVDWRNRTSGALTTAALAAAVPAVFFPWLWIAIAAALATVFALNLRFYRLCFRKRGFMFALASFGLHLLFFGYASITFGAVVAHGLVREFLGRTPCEPAPVAVTTVIARGKSLEAAR